MNKNVIKDFRIYDNKFFLNFDDLKKSIEKDIAKDKSVAGNTKLASELVNGMMEFFLSEGISEIRKDEKTGKEYISINEENWPEEAFGKCPKVNVLEQLKKFGLRG